MRPIVGVVPLWDDEKESIWMLPGYLEGIRVAGGVPVILPLTDDEEELNRAAALVQGILFTGGHDVSPELYGEAPMECVECCGVRDRMEKILLDIALKEDRSVLGICRGIQFINAALGGTLYQDLPSLHPSQVEHRQKAPYDVPAHEVTVRKDSPLYALIKKETLAVNSCHHQAVKTLAPALLAMADSPDGLVEAAYMPGRKFFWAVQWHPEFAFQKDEAQLKIFEAFVRSMIG